MKLTYIGHACFKLAAQDGTCVITDPYDESVGLAMLPLRADLITMSHEHHDHNETTMIEGAPVILHDEQPGAVGCVKTTAVSSFHDDAQGQKRGKNAIRIFEIDGLKVVHMGDQGCMPGEDVLAAIADADLMLIPVGGFYTVDAQEAKAIIERAKPRCVVPMHFLTKNGNYSVIAGVKPFLAAMGAQDTQAVDELDVTAGSAAQGVVLMKPLADEIEG